MTRDEIVSLVTSTVGQTDSASVALCQSYVQRAYEMTWNYELWRDAVTIDTSAIAVVGVNTVNLPTGFDRIVSVQLLLGGAPLAFLDPTTTTFIMQTEPTAITTQAQPTKYEEFVHTDGTRKVRLFPVPDFAYTFTISGKRTCPTLAGSDSSQIRNSDNAIISLALADMYTRLRQLGKASEMAKKAGAFLEELRKVELEQSNKQRLAKSLAVTTGTLSELADGVCARVNSWTPDNLIIAKNALRRRYRMIYDSFLWKDAVTTATANTVNAQGYIDMPAGLERAISVTVNGAMLEPVDSAFLMQVDPTIFTRSGVPTVFEEYDQTGAKRIRLYPIPDAVYPVVVAGKKTLTNLTADSSIPTLRNIDNVLIAFAASDLHSHLNQAEQAKAALDEASGALQSIKDLESQQTMRARISKPLTVSGNSLYEMADAVCARCGAYTLDKLIVAKDFVRRNYQTIYDAFLWLDSQVVATVVSDGSYLVLPEYFDRVIAVRGNAQQAQLNGVALSAYFSITPQIFEDTQASPYAFSVLTPVAVSVLPATAERLSLVSTSVNDKTPVMIRGENSTGEVTESVTLNGTVPVLTVNSYLVPLTIAKNITAGSVTVRGNTSATLFQTILAAERERKHIRLWVQPTNPGVPMNCLVLGKRKIKPLVQDEDTPLLRDIGNILITLSVADLFGQIGKRTESQDARQQAETLLKVLMDKEQNQTGVTQQVVPEVEYSYGWEDSADMAFISK